MTFKALIVYITFTILLGLFLFFIRGDFAGKACAVVACPLVIAYLIYVYFKEKRADNNAVKTNEQIQTGRYFENAGWHEMYVVYMKDHPFERPAGPNMKEDLLKRFRRREYLMWMLFFMFLLFCSIVAIFVDPGVLPILGIGLFAILIYYQFSLYLGMPVRKWLKSDIDYAVLERSYMGSRMLTYKKNGFAFGTTHIHAYTEKKVYAIDYALVEGISRRIVRLKNYEDGLYSSEEYRHFAVIHVRLPESGNIHDVEIELNEFQVQMVIDNYSKWGMCCT